MNWPFAQNEPLEEAWAVPLCWGEKIHAIWRLEDAMASRPSVDSQTSSKPVERLKIEIPIFL
jgi:hypothetical protein